MRYHPWRHARDLGLTIEFVPDLQPRATYCALHDPYPASAAWVDDYTWALRLAYLDPIETADLEHRVGDEWRVA